MMPNTERTIKINKIINKTRTICATGAGNGNMLMSHHISPNTTR